MDNLNHLARGGNLCLGKAGLTIASTASKIKTANAIDYAINGYLYSKAATDNIAMTAADEQTAGTSCLYLVCIDSSGTVSTVKGDEVSATDLAAGKPLTWPQPTSNDVVAIGAVRVDTSASATFTAGTTDLSAAGITDTYYDLFAIPARPLTS